MDIVAAGYVWPGHPPEFPGTHTMLVMVTPSLAIDHIQLAMPSGEEETARRFYSGFLGMDEVSKPAELAKRGGCWFKSGVVQIHVGVEHDFRAAKKAHPALKCADYEGLISRLCEVDIEVTEANDIPGVRRCHIHDPFGNRIELIANECCKRR